MRLAPSVAQPQRSIPPNQKRAARPDGTSSNDEEVAVENDDFWSFFLSTFVLTLGAIKFLNLHNRPVNHADMVVGRYIWNHNPEDHRSGGDYECKKKILFRIRPRNPKGGE